MTALRRCGSTALVISAVLLTGGCAIQSGTPPITPTATRSESRPTPDHVRSESLAIVEKLRALDAAALPELRQPTATECGPRSDEGVQFSWSVEGAPPSNAQDYIDRAEVVLKEDGYSTHQTTISLNDGRPLHYLGADGEGRLKIGLGSSALNTVLQLSSDCAEGNASEFG